MLNYAGTHGVQFDVTLAGQQVVSVGNSPYKIDTAAFVVETRYGVWGAQVPLKPKGYSKKKRTFGPVELLFMDGVEGRFVGLLPESEKPNLH